MRDRLNAEKLAEIEKRLVIVETVLGKLIDTLNKREDKIAEFLAKEKRYYRVMSESVKNT